MGGFSSPVGEDEMTCPACQPATWPAPLLSMPRWVGTRALCSLGNIEGSTGAPVPLRLSSVGTGATATLRHSPMASWLPRGLVGSISNVRSVLGICSSSYASTSRVVWEALYLTEHHVGTASWDPLSPHGVRHLITV